MSHKSAAFTIEGDSPILMHNGRLADPLDPFAKELKRCTSKKAKSDTDHGYMSKVEWYGGLYHDGIIEVAPNRLCAADDTFVVIPGVNLEAMFIEAGKKAKLGDAFRAGIICDGDFKVEHNGPRNVNELFESGKFTHRCSARVQNNRVMRTRAIFREWRLTFTVSYLEALLNETQVEEALDTAGAIIGLCDYTPKFGRFHVV